MRVVVTLVAVLLVGAFVPAGPGRAAPLAPRPAQAATPPGWTTYHFDNARDGYDPSAAAYGSTMTGQWTSQVVDGKLYASPLVWSGLVFAATENNTVYAFKETDGSTYWSLHLATPVPSTALPCGNISPVVGITGTPVIDSATGILYAVGMVNTPTVKYQLFSVLISTGLQAAPPRDIVFSDLNAYSAGQRGALALANGNVYVPFGGRAGDCSPYHPFVAAAPVSGGAVFRYNGQAGTSFDGAGFWAPSGEAVDGTGNVYLASGNSNNNAACTTWDHSNAVIKLAPALTELDYFVQPNWCAQSNADRDLGSTAPVLLPGGMAVIAGKTGEVWVLNSANLSSSTGKPGTVPNGCNAVFGGFAATSTTVYVPCESPGLVAITNLSTGATAFTVSWTSSFTAGAPIYVGGSVWALEEYGTGLRRVNPANGVSNSPTDRWVVGSHNRFQTPAADSGRIFAAATYTISEFNFGNITPPPPPPPPPPAIGGVYHSLPPARLVDTRTDAPGPFSSGGSVELTMLNQAGVPAANVSTVVLNVTAVDAQQAGFLAVFPGGTNWPGNSNVNFAPSAPGTPNLVLAQVGSNGKVAFINGSPGTVAMVVDVFGYFDQTGSGVSPPAGRYRPLTPARTYDTRDGRSALAPGEQRTIPIATHGGVPANASAVAINLTATNTTATGYLAAIPGGATYAGTSNVNFGPGQSASNRVIVPLAGGAVTIVNASGYTDFAIDVSGWFTDGSNPAASGGVYTPVPPSRLFDTRDGYGPLGPGGIRPLPGAGRKGISAAATTAAINIVAVNETAPSSFLAAYPDPGPWPGNSDVNTAAGRINTNAVLVRLGGGNFDVIHADGSTDFAVDVQGWFS